MLCGYDFRFGLLQSEITAYVFHQIFATFFSCLFNCSALSTSVHIKGLGKLLGDVALKSVYPPASLNIGYLQHRFITVHMKFPLYCTRYNGSLIKRDDRIMNKRNISNWSFSCRCNKDTNMTNMTLCHVCFYIF